MEPSPWEANRQEIPLLFMELKGSLPCSLKGITMFTRTHRWSLSWARWIQSTPFYPISLRSFLILSSRLCLGLPSGLFPSSPVTKLLYHFSSRSTCPAHLILLDLIFRCHPLNSASLAHGCPLNFLNDIKMQSIIKQIIFIEFLS